MTGVSNTGPSAAAISRLVRTAGVRPLPSGTRPGVRGVRVTEARTLGLVTINVDLPTTTQAHRVAGQLARELRDLGYVVRPNPHDAAILYVQHREGTFE